MSEALSLVVGLGNPGPEYEETRHNAGFLFVEGLLVAHGGGAGWKREARFAGRVARFSLARRELWLLCPETFMNRSGESVAALAHYYRLPPERILVAHDELDLPVGELRLKFGGGAGGHNGVSDVIEKLGTRDFHRLRIGIGRPAGSGQVVSYVLRKAPPGERDLVNDAVRHALDQADDIIQGRMLQAMNRLHVQRTN